MATTEVPDTDETVEDETRWFDDDDYEVMVWTVENGRVNYGYLHFPDVYDSLDVPTFLGRFRRAEGGLD